MLIQLEARKYAVIVIILFINLIIDVYQSKQFIFYEDSQEIVDDTKVELLQMFFNYVR